MKSILRRFVAAVFLLGVSVSVIAQDNVRSASVKSLHYPKTPTVDHVDDYFGTRVADPYRWMEDLNSPEVKQWVEDENKVTFGYLETIPQRAAIKQRLEQVWNFERYSPPMKRGTRYFFSKNDGLQNQAVLYVADSLTSEPRVLLDPNKLSQDGTVALGPHAITDDGKLMAYAIQTAGSDWEEWKVRDVATGQDLPDHIVWSKFSGASWTKDGSGFFYSAYDPPKEGTALSGENYYQKLYFHKLGTPQSQDVLVYQTPEHKEWGFGGVVTDDGHYLIVYISQGTDQRNRVYYKDLTKPDAAVVKLLDDFDAEYDFVDNDGPVFWFRTDNSAPMYRLIAIDTRHPEKANWKEILPQGKDTLEAVSAIDNKFVAQYLQDARSAVRIYDLNGKYLRDMPLPGIGTVAGANGEAGFDGKRTDQETFYSLTSFATPGVIYRYDMETGKTTVFQQPKLSFTPSDYETKQVFYHSKDGTRVPMFITYKKGITLDGQNPTYLYAYGGFNISLTPAFSPANLVWMEMGGVFAVPNLRGGGEYGKAWHEGGMKLHKQNVFDDFIAAAEWLIANKYTSTPKLAIGGASNGGLLIGACLTQRPDLYGAALPAVGVMDMLRFNKFTIGWAWESDYGSPDKNKDEFEAIYKYSPYHNIKPAEYPPTLITTADHDDRVVPIHSFKFAAKLQADQKGSAPVLIRIETRAGHGAGKPTTKQIEEAADRWAFLLKNLNVQAPAATKAGN